jgi:carbamoyl-phosphate synthase large subunit
MNILFCSAGRRVELLRAFRRAYSELGLTGNIVATDIDPLAPALQVADRPYIVPQLTSDDYIPILAGICRQEAVDLVFPLIDPDILVLARHRTELEATGARLAVVSLEATALANDKWLTTEFFRGLGLAVPRSWLPGDIDIAQAEFPLFIKPRGGSAGRHTYRVHSAEELTFFSKYVPNPIIEEYLPGPEITSDVIAWLDGEVLGVVSRRRIEVRWGEVAKGMTVHDPRIIDACVSIARALPAVGPFTVQCLIKGGVPHFTEINARLGGGLPLGIAAGLESPKLLLAKAAGLEVAIPPLGTYKTGLYLTRFDESFFLTTDELEQMESHRL